MRNYDPEKIEFYTDGLAQHIANTKAVLDLLNNQPRTRDTDILRDSLLKTTVDLTSKVGNTLLESMLDYYDVELPYPRPDLVTHTFNVPELDDAYDVADDFEDDEEFFDEEDDDYETA
jgi:hypothetical protein